MSILYEFLKMFSYSLSNIFYFYRFTLRYSQAHLGISSIFTNFCRFKGSWCLFCSFSGSMHDLNCPVEFSSFQHKTLHNIADAFFIAFDVEMTLAVLVQHLSKSLKNLYFFPLSKEFSSETHYKKINEFFPSFSYLS